MNPRRTRAPWALPLLCATLGTPACDSSPSSPTPPEERPPALRVSVQTQGPAYCREGMWTLSVSVEDATAERVQLITNDEAPTRLEAPYQHVVDCATHAEGRFEFKARVWVDGKHVDAEAVAVTVDRTPPTVVSVKPGRRYPSVSSPMAFVFSEPLLPESLSSAPTDLQESEFGSLPVPLAHQAVLSEGGTVLELVPTAPIQPYVELRATLLQRTMTDLAGNPLALNLPDTAFMHSATYSPFASVAEPLFPDRVDPLQASFTIVRSESKTLPVVAYTDYSWFEDREPIIQQWDGEAWHRLALPRAANELTGPPPFYEVASRDGVLLARWFEKNTTTGMSVLRVATYTGTKWEHLPAPYETLAQSPHVTMVLAPQGRPILAIEGSTAPNQPAVRVIRWTGTAWQTLGELHNGNPASQTPPAELALATDDTRVVVSWVEVTGGLEPRHNYIHVRTFENGEWVPVGEPIPFRATLAPSGLTLSIQPDRRVVMAWIETNYEPPVIIDDYGHKSLDEALRFSSASLDAAQPNWTPSERIGIGLASGRYDALRIIVGPDLEPWLIWNERSRYTLSGRAYLSRLRATGAEPSQLIADYPLFGIQLDDDGTPWALLGDTVTRLQQ
ncbi:hypothetical protein GCM10012319_28590 [Comamonas sp. KCTC 72670]|nr:hypothetical protein GCM10012319_28590 [Comamonas sp. KCTC 72670]